MLHLPVLSFNKLQLAARQTKLPSKGLLEIPQHHILKFTTVAPALGIYSTILPFPAASPSI